MADKILIVSNEPFSDCSSNGRTMKNFLLNIPKQSLAQFYLHGIPDHAFCSNYFCVSDQDALRAFLLKKEEPQKFGYHTAGKKNKDSRPKRNYRNLVLRDIVWQSMLWWKADFDTFLAEFKPDIVLLQAGDAPFMYKVARKIAKRCSAKLMMYNSESYVLKKRMYASVEKNPFWHFFLMSSLKVQYRKFMRKADYCIYNTEALEKAYQHTYPHPGKSCTLYTTSEMQPLPYESGDVFRLLYCGNLGVGRDQPLNELAQVLYEIDNTAKLDIYGKFTTQESQQMVCANPNVEYHGFVDYSEIPALMSRASMLVHCENNDRLENLRFAFSTKIADSLASTRPFLVYASQEYPFAQYLMDNKCAHVAGSADALRSVLQRCITENGFLTKFTQNAKLVAAQKHSKEENCMRIQEIISMLCNEEKD